MAKVLGTGEKESDKHFKTRMICNAKHWNNEDEQSKKKWKAYR